MKIYSPGYLIADKMIDDGITIEQLSESTGVIPETIKQIIDNELVLTEEICVLLERGLGIPKYMLKLFQDEYQYYKSNASTKVDLVQKVLLMERHRKICDLEKI